MPDAELTLLYSLKKFNSFGSDRLSGGLVVHYGRKATWAAEAPYPDRFNTTGFYLVETLLSTELVAYTRRIHENTRLLYTTVQRTCQGYLTVVDSKDEDLIAVDTKNIDMDVDIEDATDGRTKHFFRFLKDPRTIRRRPPQ